MSDELQEMFDDAEAEGDGIAEAIRYAGELIADAVSELAEAIGKAGEL